MLKVKWRVRYFFSVFVFSGPHLWHIEVPRLGVQSQLQLPACATATATRDPGLICDPHHGSWQCRILNPLSKARDRTSVLTDASRVHYRWATTGTPWLFIFEFCRISFWQMGIDFNFILLFLNSCFSWQEWYGLLFFNIYLALAIASALHWLSQSKNHPFWVGIA